MEISSNFELEIIMYTFSAWYFYVDFQIYNGTIANGTVNNFNS